MVEAVTPVGADKARGTSASLADPIPGDMDRELVAALIQKNRKAAAEFVARFSDPLYRYVRHRLMPRADLVDDLVQEVFLAAWDNLASFQGTSSLKNWMLGIARHKVETHYRKELRRHLFGSSGKWGGGTWFGAFRIPNLVPRSLVNIVGCSSRGRGNCGKLRAISNWASKPVIRSFPSAVRTVEKQLRALASSPPELLVFPRFA